MYPTPTFDETSTFEPAPFADLFGEPEEDLFPVRTHAAWRCAACCERENHNLLRPLTSSNGMRRAMLFRLSAGQGHEGANVDVIATWQSRLLRRTAMAM